MRKVEETRPEQAAAAIDALTDPLSSVRQAIEESDLPQATVQHLLERLERRYLDVTLETERLKTDLLVRQFEQLASASLQSITLEDLEKMDAYKRTLIAAIATDKRELLDGRPTERISVEDRVKLDEVAKALLREAERRGLMPQTNPDTGRTHLVDRPDAPPLVREGRERMKLIDVEVLE